MNMRKAVREPALWAGLGISAAVGLLFYVATAKSIESDSRERFGNLTRTAQFAINARIKNYTDVLRGGVSTFNTNPDFTRERFRHYVAGLDLDRHFPGIATINYGRHVAPSEMAQFLAEVKAQARPGDGYPDYHVNPTGPRSSYTPLVYIEPVERWPAKVGYDLESKPAVAKALAESRDTGAISTSGQPLDVLTGPNRMGLGMRLPIYRPGMPLETVAQRRAAYLGTLGMGFSVEKLVQGVLDELPMQGTRVIVADAGSGTTLFDSAASPNNPSPQRSFNDGHHFIIQLPLDFNGRQWNAHFSIAKSGQYSGFDEWFPWLAAGAGFLVAALLYALYHALASSRMRAIHLAREMTRELRESQHELQLSHEHLRRLAAHADQIKEEERKRIAREIHDDLGQNLLALRIDAELLANRTSHSAPRLHERVAGTLQQIDTIIRSVRQIINDLRPNVLDLGLNAAVDWLVADFKRRTGIQCELLETHREFKLEDHYATAFFRILQESLHNITRHAKASYVRVDLRLTEDGVLAMTVADNGQGMRPGTRDKPQSFGLVGIEERIRILGGNFAIHSSPGLGTTIAVSVRIASPRVSQTVKPMEEIAATI